MSGSFVKLLNMSLTGSVVILVVLLARLCMKRSPKIYSYALWGVVLFRLLCPLSITAGLSVLKPIPADTAPGISSVSYRPIQQAVQFSRNIVEVRQEQKAIEKREQPKPGVSPMEIAACIWLTGVCAMSLYSLAQYVSLRRRLSKAEPLQGEVYLTDRISAPFVMGVICPKIYLPSSTPMEERCFIIAHERHHIRRGDCLWKLLGYGALCLHWFNPLVWLAFCLAGRDMEMSCDEAVIGRLGENIRADYSQALLRLAIRKKGIAGMPLSFGEGDTKGRVMNMARWKKPKVWVSAVCAVICLVIAAACALNPREEEKPLEEMTRITGPADIAAWELHFTLPEGCTQEMQEKGGSDWKDTRDGCVIVMTDGASTIGGVMAFPIPENYQEDQWHWVYTLNLPENRDETLGSFIDGNPGDLIVAEFFSDVPEGQARTVLNQHNLYFWDGWIYDLWFDKLTVKQDVMAAILSSVRVGEQQEPSIPFRMDAPPDGVSYELTSDSALRIRKDSSSIGGIISYEIPENAENPFADYAWLADAGVPEMEDESLLQSASGSEYGDWEIRFESDVPPGAERRVSRHTFFIQDDRVFDIWFDMQRTDEETMNTVLKALTVSAGGESPAIQAANMPYIILEMPAGGYSYQTEADGSVSFRKGSDLVGGIVAYAIPEGVYDPYDDVFLWLEEVGIPDYENKSLVCMGGISDSDGGWKATFASAGAEGQQVQRTHRFRVTGNTVYDFWLDEIQLDYKTRSAFLNAVQYVEPAGQPTEQAVTVEDRAFDRAQSVMKTIQNSAAIHIRTVCQYQNAPEQNYTEDFYDCEIGFVKVAVNVNGETRGELVADDRSFTGQGASEELNWTEAEPPSEWRDPWLEGFVFIRRYVAYMGTLADGDGEQLLFRVDAPFEDGETAAPFYFATFCFDSDGNFLNVELQINQGRDDGYFLTQSVVSIDQQSVDSKILSELARAAK